MKNKINLIIENSIKEYINEYGRYDDSTTPYNSRVMRDRNLDNPMFSDYGNHSTNDVVSHVSTFDYNGANFRPSEKIVLTENKYMFYKVKNFSNDKIKGTLDLFGKGAKGEKELRKAIDTLNGASYRNRRNLFLRVITTESNIELAEKTNFIQGGFWEFSFDGNEWYILKPNPVQKMQKSNVIIKK